ncbi:MAG: anhydro-N-acetylmuramic acid kinase [Alphaproteobacteria bacterium]|nr:anhydro-N-acetylmuramic acid kinase [Alphaproteobacteria bacterium]
MTNTDKQYLCIGIMTGNSLDAADVVLSRFQGQKICDICGESLDFPKNISERFLIFKEEMRRLNGDIQSYFNTHAKEFSALHNDYINLVAEAVQKMIKQHGIDKQTVDAVGFHGQTCYHFPPSVAGENEEPNTLQIGSAQMLSDILQMPVVFDFRSDDIFCGGEGAPLAPMHNRHLSEDLKTRNMYPAIFCNGGNTGNIAAVYDDKVTGFDCGPFNHFIDTLTRTEKNTPCDLDGVFGKQGRIHYELLDDLFDGSVLTSQNKNFLETLPPKSGDPAWYKMPESLKASSSVSFYDRVRTLEFFSAYIMVYALKFLPIATPDYFLVFGGGWKNPLILNDFRELLTGRAKVLPRHQEIFAKLANKKAQVLFSDDIGYSGKYMEARIFADMAKCFLTKEPFSTPEITGCKTPTVGGIITYPGAGNQQLWSRAAKGWSKKKERS